MIRSRTGRVGGRPAPPGVRAAVLAGTGAALIGAAVWAGAVGRWTGRPSTPDPSDAPTLPALPTVATEPTPTLAPPATSGGSWEPTVLLYVLGAVLLVLLLLVLASMLRNRGSARPPLREAAAAAAPPPVTPPAMPDPDRPFDAREAADYVIACWDELEHRAADAGFGRQRQQTPTEFLEQLLDGRTIDRRVATDLLGLYQHARFDHVRLLPDTAARARAATDTLTAALAGSWATP